MGLLTLLEMCFTAVTERFNGSIYIIYKVPIVQALKSADRTRCASLAAEILNRIDEHKTISEARLNVWCALMHSKVVGTSFFIEPTVSVTVSLGVLRICPSFQENYNQG